MRRILALMLFGTALSASAQTVIVGSPSAHCGQQVSVPVTVDSVSGMLALEFRIAYDPALLSAPAATAGSLTSGFSISSNASGGTLRVAMASGTPVSGGGTVANLTFNVASGATGAANLAISNVLVNDAPRAGSPGTISITCLQPPDPPVPVAPPNGATAANPPVTLSWMAVAGAANYRLNFGTTSPPPVVIVTGATSYPVTTEPGTKYYWSVQAINEAGTADGPIWSFTTAGTACQTPAAPQLSAPAQVISGDAFDLTWSTVAGATAYILEESTSSSFPSPASTVTAATSVSLTRTASSDGSLYFRVHARNGTAPCNVDGPTSAAAAMRIVVRPALAAGTRVVPVVGTTPGSFGSFFRTSMQLHNPTAQRISGRLVFHRQATPGSAGDPSLAYSIGPNETTSFADIVAAIGVSSAVGSLDLVPDSGSGAPVSAVRVFNDAGAAGTTGMTLDQLSLADAVKAGQRAVVIAPMAPVAARMNIGIRTLLDGVTMTVTVRARDGFMIQSSRRTYPPTYFVQLPLSDFTGGSVLLGDEVIDFDVESGSALVYGAITDNLTQDPAVQIARPLP